MDLPLCSQLEERRMRLKWTRHYLAAVSGYHINTVDRVLKGDPRINLRTLLDVAQAMGLELEIQAKQKSA